MNASRIKRLVFLLLILALTLSTGAIALAEGPADSLHSSQTNSTAAASTTTLLNSVIILVFMQAGFGIAGVRYVRSMNRMFDQICGGDGPGRTLASTDQPLTPLS